MATNEKSGKKKTGPSMVTTVQKKALVTLAVSLLRILRFIAPFGVGALSWRVIAALVGYHSIGARPGTRSAGYRIGKRILDGWFACEAIFYFFSSWRKMQVQRRNEVVEYMSAEDRKILFDRCLDTVDDPRQFTSSWMRNHPFEELRVGNIEAWLAWGLFSRTPEELRGEARRQIASKDCDSTTITEWDQLQNSVKRLEEATNHKFLPGHDGNARGMRFTLEPVETTHRPLIYYAVIQGGFQNLIVPTFMRINGFKLKRNAQGGLHCWVREGRQVDGIPRDSNSDLPVVFLHGIGVGLLPYLGFVKSLIQASNGQNPERAGSSMTNASLAGRPLVFVELPIISQTYSSHSNGVLLRDQFVKDMRELLEDHAGFKNGGCFIGHSFGTVCLSWLVARAPDMLRSLLFIDPVVFLLHKTNALQAICYKEPVRESEKLMHYIMRTEITFSAFTRRHFTWYANVLFVEQIPENCPTAIVLSERDNIVPTDAVSRYLKRKALPNISSYVFDKASHGEYLFNAEVAERVLEIAIQNASAT